MVQFFTLEGDPRVIGQTDAPLLISSERSETAKPQAARERNNQLGWLAGELNSLERLANETLKMLFNCWVPICSADYDTSVRFEAPIPVEHEGGLALLRSSSWHCGEDTTEIEVEG
jgi:hypothetical protein